jgi:hypothetical protein
MLEHARRDAMIIIRGRIATYGALWFDEAIPARPAVDILLVSNSSKTRPGFHCTPFMTLVNDLTLPEESLLSGFSRTAQYEIRRAGARDAVEHTLLTEPAAHLQAFCDFYDRFAETKSLFQIYRKELSAACEAGKLVLSSAAHAGTPVVWHAYLISGSRAMLLYSASHFRSADDNAARARIARANRWAHWQDMLRIKALGVRWFDWGGHFGNEDVPAHAGINRFKRQFGGQEEQNYDCKMALTLRGRLALVLLPLMDHLERWKTKASALKGGVKSAVAFCGAASAYVIADC